MRDKSAIVSQKNDVKYNKLRENIIDGLAKRAQWAPLSNALKSNQSVVTWIPSDQAMSVYRVLCEPGQAARDLHHRNHPIEFDAYLTQVINPLISKGELCDGSRFGEYDDRKIRWSDYSNKPLIDAGVLRLSVGPTSYPQCQNDIRRNQVEALQLMHSGLIIHDDPYAYFARGMGVVVIPLTIEGHTFIGRRSNTKDYSGLLSFISGWATFFTNVSDINFYQDAVNELVEEVRLLEPIGSDLLRFVGLAGQPLTGETDLVFIAQTDLSDDHFAGTSWPEHENWLAIRSADDAKSLLEHGCINGIENRQSIMFSSRFGLEFLINHHWSV